MLETVVYEECERIQEDAEIRKDIARFIGDICRENWEVLEEYYKDEVAEEELQRYIFQEIKKEINETMGYCGPIGITVVDSSNPYSIRDVKVDLGWIDYDPMDKEKTSYSIYVTEKGYKILNEIRNIKGQNTVQEENQQFQKMLLSQAE